MKTRHYQKPVTSTQEMRQILSTMSATWTDEALLSKRMLLYACERLDDIAELLKKRKRSPRKMSPYHQFLSKGMKAGKTPSQVAQEWKQRVQ